MSHELVRVSKAGAGGSDDGTFDAIGGFGLGAEGATNDNSPAFYTQGRWVSEDGDTIGFKTAEGLLSDDVNGTLDSYIWRDGSLFRLPGTTDAEGELEDRPIVSLDGETVAFMSFRQLLPSDGDTAADVYVARVGGGFSEPPPLLGCVPDGDQGCQGAGGAPPADGVSGSAGYVGRGNLMQARSKRKPCSRGKRRVKRGGKLRCVSRKQRKRKVARVHHSRHANESRRAGK